jgi:hypothetical protein
MKDKTKKTKSTATAVITQATPDINADKLTSTLTRTGLFTQSPSSLTVVGSATPNEKTQRKPWNHYHDVPPWPRLKWCRIPAPPYVQPEWSDGEKISFMAHTWRNTIEQLIGKIYWPFKARKIKQGKTTKFFDPVEQNKEKLLAAANLMVEFEVQPVSWIIFSYHRMSAILAKPSSGEKRKKRKKKAFSAVPPLHWVFNRDRLEKRKGWYESVRTGYGLEGRTILTPTHYKLIRTHYFMRRDLELLENPAQPAIDAVVDRYFPTHYKALLRSVQREIDAYHAQLVRRALRGEWIWTHAGLNSD